MTTQERDELKRSIEKEIAALREEVALLEKAMYPERGAGPVDRVAHLQFKQDQQVTIRRHEEATRRLNRLIHALRRIDRPEYGLWLECEEPIPLARLKLLPESQYCVACMEELGLT